MLKGTLSALDMKLSSSIDLHFLNILLTMSIASSNKKCMMYPKHEKISFNFTTPPLSSTYMSLVSGTLAVIYLRFNFFCLLQLRLPCSSYY